MAAASAQPLNRLGIAELVMSYLPEDDHPLKDQQEKTRNVVSAWIQECFLQTPECGVDRNWWKSIIDGKVHHHGPLVFDEGLHGGDREPGFYDSIQQAFEFAVARPKGRLTVPFYLHLHRLACSHFAANTAGVLKADAAKQTQNIWFLYPLVLGNVKERQYEESLERRIRASLPHLPGVEEKVKSMSEEARRLEEAQSGLRVSEINQEITERIERMNAYIQTKSRLLGLAEPIARITRYAMSSSTLKISHPLNDPKQIEAVITQLFANFEKAVAQANSQDEVIIAIADLFQMLEWLHAFVDGNSRTNLTLLSKLLADYGLNPPILEHPYVSLCWTLDAWVRYLKEGMTLWRQKGTRWQQQV
jgi:prophage maintenance system killer protein